MDPSDSDRDPVEELAEEFVERYRRGERPSLEEYTKRYPEQAERIRALFPALVVMEKVRPEPTDGWKADVESSAAAAQPQRLGDYRILRELGRGGMGVVYEAEQESLGRHVALKVLPAHALLDPRYLQRFRREARAAARLHHSNIVPVHGVGEQDGLHYYVMQLVQGQGLDQVLAELKRLRQARQAPAAGPAEQESAAAVARSLLSGQFAAAAPAGDSGSSTVTCGSLPTHAQGSSLTEAGWPYWYSVARIGIQVADALGHASSQGILHRDVKPSNLLLDTCGSVWVTDFGLAKVQTDGDDLTHTGDVVGTLRYMAPERFAGQADIRSDLYALGLTLYELLTLRSAFDETDRNRLIAQVMHETPSRPRKIDPAIPRDLETIVLKAIAREPAQRYQTPAELVEDLQRFVEDRPIKARRLGLVQLGWRWCRRNPMLAELAAGLFAVLLAGSVVSTWQAVRATRAREAEAARAEGEKKAKETAENRLTQIEKGIDLLGSIFHNLNPRAEEKEHRSLRVLLGERLDQATRELEGEAIGDPLTVARLQLTLGNSQLGLGYPEKAIALLTRARATLASRLGPDHPDTLYSMDRLAGGYQDAGKLDLAVPLFEETLKLRTAQLGRAHKLTMASVNNLALAYQLAGKLDRAVPLFEEALRFAEARFRPDDPRRLTCMNNLGIAYREAGNLDLALPLLQRAYELSKRRLGADHADTLVSMNDLAVCYRFAGKLDLAVPLAEDTFRLMKSNLGPNHPNTLKSMGNLAAAYRVVRKYDQALPLHKESLEFTKAKLGPDHPDTLGAMNNLALCYGEAGKPDLAVSLFQETLRLSRRKLGADHPNTLRCMNSLADGYRRLGQFDRALALWEEALPLARARLGTGHPVTFQVMNSLAVHYWRMKRLDRSVPLLEEVVRLNRGRLGEAHPDTLRAAANLGVNYRDAGRLPEAIALLEGAYRKGRKHPSLAWVVMELVSAYVKAGKLAEAIDLRKDELAEARRQLKPDSPELRGFLAQTGSHLLDLGAYADAESVLRECLALRTRKEPAWAVFGVKSMLGEALAGQKKYADAEPLLLEGYRGLKGLEGKIPVPLRQLRLNEAIRCLVQLYEATNQKEKASAWRDRLEPTRTPGR
jgi:serine/threonine protein kinase